MNNFTKKNILERIPTKFHKLEFLYVAIAIFFGVIFILIIPPGWNPDETQHYCRLSAQG